MTRHETAINVHNLDRLLQIFDIKPPHRRAMATLSFCQLLHDGRPLSAVSRPLAFID
jgi:hypothetical protein